MGREQLSYGDTAGYRGRGTKESLSSPSPVLPDGIVPYRGTNGSRPLSPSAIVSPTRGRYATAQYSGGHAPTSGGYAAS
eukprot:339216-Rhodomonas_salina.1